MKFLVILEDAQKKLGQVTLVGRMLSASLLAAGHDVNVFDFHCFSEMYSKMDEESEKEVQSLAEMKKSLDELIKSSHAILYLTFEENFPGTLTNLIGRARTRDRYRWFVQGVNCMLLGAHAQNRCASKLVWQLMLQLEMSLLWNPGTTAIYGSGVTLYGSTAYELYPESSHLEETAVPMV
jgi:hypothetical protein